MFFKWLPWKYMVRRVARHNGFLDPILILSRLGRFAQPSEVGEPIELLRAGLVFHARGLMNTRAIQNNLDWIWPYWVERQFNPNDPSFVPRAFSISHVNLTHRNWVAVGAPDSPYLPIVDPCGLVTPYYDGWSLDAWIIEPGGAALLPSKSRAVAQTWELEADNVAVETSLSEGKFLLRTRVEALPGGPAGACRIRYQARSAAPAWLAISLRPYNPEGVSFIHDARLRNDRMGWDVDGFPAVSFSEAAGAHLSSEYHLGDVFHKLLREVSEAGRSGAGPIPGDIGSDAGSHCKVGMATASALFPLEAGREKILEARIDLAGDRETRKQFPHPRPPGSWSSALTDLAELRVPDPHFEFLYRAALRSLLLHSPDDVFPGPYTYKRFWFRDAAFILDAMLSAGMADRVERTLDSFARRQTLGGYFLSQEGEWDSNGEALWILRRWCEATARAPKPAWMKSIMKAADWIARKRVPASKAKDERVRGLFPAGFSAEHLGPNDFYYWDDFWGVAGLQSAAWLLQSAAAAGSGGAKGAEAEAWRASAQRAKAEAEDFLSAIDRSLKAARRVQDLGAIPASPLRRMDAGAIGSLAASYPLRLWAGDDGRLRGTLDFLLAKCMYRGAFFQDMIHSGVNAYLTLHMAQALLRAGDARCFELIKNTACLATSTGQWPEAIHPHTLGGCMGDGQHVWAAAEWVLMMRNLFLREEERVLVIASGIPQEWLRPGAELGFGPAPTAFGKLSVSLRVEPDGVRVSWSGDWHTHPACVVVRLPGRAPMTWIEKGDGEAVVPNASGATVSAR